MKKFQTNFIGKNFFYICFIRDIQFKSSCFLLVPAFSPADVCTYLQTFSKVDSISGGEKWGFGLNELELSKGGGASGEVAPRRRRNLDVITPLCKKVGAKVVRYRQ